MIIAIGDVHGEITKLERLWEKLPDAPVVFLGDYVDRGENPEAVLDFFAATKNTTFIMGNHEEMMIRWPREWSHYGDLSKRDVLMEKLPTMVDYHVVPTNLPTNLQNTNISAPIKNTQYYFSHAGFTPWKDLPDSDLDPDTLRWQRILPLQKEVNAMWKDTAIIGHTPLHEPFLSPRLIAIDTGACFGYPLTAVVLPTECDEPPAYFLQSD